MKYLVVNITITFLSEKFNKNKHKIDPFMSSAILESSKTKFKLTETKIRFPSQENINRYKDSDLLSTMSNYRPISLLPIFSKILQKLVALRVTKFLDENNLLYKHQYGF